jgi:hypothetical protein
VTAHPLNDDKRQHHLTDMSQVRLIHLRFVGPKQVCHPAADLPLIPEEPPEPLMQARLGRQTRPLVFFLDHALCVRYLRVVEGGPGHTVGSGLPEKNQDDSAVPHPHRSLIFFSRKGRSDGDAVMEGIRTVSSSGVHNEVAHRTSEKTTEFERLLPKCSLRS